MGTWGSGNFEDDTALDYLADFAASIVKEIEQAISDPRSLEPDEYEGVVVPCQIEILCHLYEGMNSFRLPEPEVIESWKSTYLSVWDRYIDQLSPAPGYRDERRKVIVETFDRLLRPSRQQKG